MDAFKENIIVKDLDFPVDIFIQDNLKSNVIVEPHWHECFELLYMMEGSAEQRVNEKFFTSRKHDLIILYEGDVHSTYCRKGEDIKILVIKFLPDVIGGNYSRMFESKYIIPFLNHKSDNIYHLTDVSKNSDILFKLMMELYDEFTTKDVGYEIYVKGYIYQLIALLVRNNIIGLYNQPNDYNQSDINKLDVLFKYIEEHYSEHINLQKAADMLNFSYSYFSRYFKRITGRSFKEYIDFVKICEAEKLILSTNMNISQAAYEAGFSNVSSFNRLFRRVRGYPPGNIKRTKTAKN